MLSDKGVWLLGSGAIKDSGGRGYRRQEMNRFSCESNRNSEVEKPSRHNFGFDGGQEEWSVLLVEVLFVFGRKVLLCILAIHSSLGWKHMAHSILSFARVANR